MKDEVQIKLFGRLANFVKEAAATCNCTVEDIVSNIIYSRLAERSAIQAVYPDLAEHGYMNELLMRDGELLLTGEKLFAAIREMRIAELEDIKKMREIIDGLMESSFRTMPGGSA